MSRGFVKEDDQEEAPFIPPRAPLPGGMPNYVTPRGHQMLLDEKGALEDERRTILEKAEKEEIGDVERRRELAVINGKLDLLAERIATAQLVQPEAEPKEVRYGTTVTFKHLKGAQKGKEFTFTLVGADEANVKEGRIAFTAPIARALIGRGTGEQAKFQLGEITQELEIKKIS